MGASLEAGVAVVDKPSGPTSRRVVDAVVRVLGLRKVGHAGTLDPFAEGVLLLAWGRATALVPYLQEGTKHYTARVRLGRTTDTQDRTGTVTATCDPSAVSEEDVRGALPAFRGEIEQVPPMYSALKHEGRRLYRAAREGVEVPRAPRRRSVYELELTAWDPPGLELRVACQAGTYVRTLAHDLGQVLGVGASLDALVRTGVGAFSRSEALPAAELESIGREAFLERALTPAEALADWPRVEVPGDEVDGVRFGSWRDPHGRLAAGGRACVFAPDGRLLALAERTPDGDARLLRVMEGGA